MMNEPVNTSQVWIEIEDHLIPSLQLDACEQAVYFNLFRRSRLLGKPTVRIGIIPLARATRLSTGKTRNAVRSLARKGCLKIIKRDRWGHTLEVLAPAEIPGCIPSQPVQAQADLEAANCYREAELRAAILRREHGRCFYCLRSIPDDAVFDHAIPLAQGGDDSYRNIVACCYECNLEKGSQSPADLLRSLYRRNRLNSAELESRLAALEALQRGELKPAEAGKPDLPAHSDLVPEQEPTAPALPLPPCYPVCLL